METLHHRLAAVWFADIVEFTRQAAEDEERALRVVGSFQDAARDVARRHEGRIVKFIGDAALAEFGSTESAVRAALQLRAACAERASRAGVECPELRIAVHVGDVTTATDGDVYGDGVNVAARLVKVVEPGEVWVSQDVWRQLRQRPRFRFAERGAPELKGLERIEAYAVEAEGAEVAEDAGSPGDRVRSVLQELQRRNVYRVAVVYAVIGWLVIQVVAATFPTLGLSRGLARAVMLLVILGFPVAVSLAWAYELTPQGLRRTRSTPGDTRPRGRRGLVRQAAVAVVLAGAVAMWLVFGPEKQAGGTNDTATGSTLDPARIAVLYFDDYSEGRVLEHLASGITEKLVHDLAQVPALDVISREGVKPYRSAEVPLDSIARSLGAGTLVEGSVTQSGDRVRVTAQLIDGSNITHLESVVVEQSKGDLFALQDSLVAEISRKLRRRLGTEIRLQQSRHATSSVEAWELLQRAEGLRTQAIQARDDAIKASLRAQADSLLAGAEWLDPQWIEPILLRGRLSLEDGSAIALQRGMGHAERALALVPRDARALALRGTLGHKLAWEQSDSTAAAALLSRAEQDLRTAVGTDRSLAGAWISLADLLYNAKWELRGARNAAQRAYEEDAFLLEDQQFIWLCDISMQLKDFPGAARWCAEGRRRLPGSPYLIMVELVVLASEGARPDPSAAWQHVDDLSRLPDPEFNVPAAQMVTAAVLARAQDPDSALAVAKRARAAAPGEWKAYMDYLESYVQLQLGDRMRALRLLREFLTDQPSMRARVAQDYWFERLKDDPLFEALVDRARLPIFCHILCEPPGS